MKKVPKPSFFPKNIGQNWNMKMLNFADIYISFVHAMRQNTVNNNVFCYGVTKPCKYQPFGLQRVKSMVNSSVLLK